MRFDAVFDAFYVLSALSGTGLQVCPTSVASVPVAHMATPSRFAFVDVHVVPMDTERVLRHQTVVVEAGRITALGPASQISVPTGAVRIDGRGRYLMPGLADMHTHYRVGESEDDALRIRYRYLLRSYLAHGVTTIRSHQAFSIEHMRREQEQTFLPIANGEGAGPRVYYPAPMPPPSIRPESVVAYLAAAKATGYRMIWLGPRNSGLVFTQDSLLNLAVEDSLRTIGRRLGFVFSSHTHGLSFEQLLEWGTYGGSFEHLSPLTGLMRRPGADTSAAGYLAMGVAVQRAGAFMSVTLNCWVELHKSRVGVGRRFVKALQDGGARLLVGSDVWDIGASANSVIYELENLVSAGLTPYQALVAGTRNVAEYFRLLDSSGTVAVGKRADLVLLPDNPLTDVRHAREPVGTMIAGRWLDRAALDQGLLASPRAWVEYEVSRNTLPQQPGAWQFSEEARHGRIRDLRRWMDSLSVVKPSDSTRYERVVRQATTALSGFRETLAPIQRATSFDATARVWMREQARRGYPVTVSGVTPTP